MTEPLVIIGNGMAATRLVDQLVDRAPGRYAITIIGDEPHFAYNRVLLSSVLASDTEFADLPLKPEQWWRASGVKTVIGSPALSVDLVRRRIRVARKPQLSFSKLVFATGSQALRLPIPGADLPGVLVFRTLSDVEALLKLSNTAARVVVIGGGLLGIEAAYGLARRGARVTLVHLMDRLMERQLDDPAASIVRASLERQGITVLLSAKTTSIKGNTKVESVTLEDGRIIAADAVVMAAGIKPDSRLAEAAGLSVRRGILVDSNLQTSWPGVYAIGECAEIDSQCCGLVEPAYAQSDTLARVLSGDTDSRYVRDIAATNLKVSGLPVFSAGDFLGGEGTSAIVLRDQAAGFYKKLVVKDGALSGAVLVGDTSDGGWYLELIRKQEPVASFRSLLAFGRSFCKAELPDRLAA